MGGQDVADEALMLRYRNGDASAFETLYERHKGPLFRYLKRQCRNPASAEELLQDVWMNLIRARSRYQVQAKFTTFLYRIAHNRLIDFHRSSIRHVPTDDGDPDEISVLPEHSNREPDRQVDSERQFARFNSLLGELPDEQREVFLLHEESGLSLEDIARTTGVGRETAKSRLRYAVSKLRKRLRDEA